MKIHFTVIALLITTGASLLLATDPPATLPSPPPRAARSVHLSYIAPPAIAFYAEATVQQSVPGSYFEVCGFQGGYFGIQALSAGKKVGIFSVWDNAKGNDPKAVDQKNRVETLFIGDGVRASRFGGEGTGGHSDFDLPWKIGDTYRFFLTSKIDDQKTDYAAYIFDPQKKSWFHVATFAAPGGGKHLTGLYSFIEDFRRDTRSATETRRAKYGNQWIQTVDGKWEPIIKARFTASGATWEARDTINAGLDGNDFFLQTGGDTVQQTKLKDVIQRTNSKSTMPEVPQLDSAK
jgi:hypothetical protein